MYSSRTLAVLGQHTGYVSTVVQDDLINGVSGPHSLDFMSKTPVLPGRTAPLFWHVCYRQCSVVLLAQVHSNSQLQVSQDRGHVAAESAAELEVLFTPKQSGQFAAVLEVEVRGGKTLKLPIRCGLLASHAG